MIELLSKLQKHPKIIHYEIEYDPYTSVQFTRYKGKVEVEADGLHLATCRHGSKSSSNASSGRRDRGGETFDHRICSR